MARKMTAMLGIVVALLLATVGTASAQYSGNTQGVNDSTLTLGQPLIISGCCFSGAVTTTLLSDPVVLGTTQANANGQFSLSAQIPSNTTPGTHTIQSTGQALDGSGPLTLTTQVTVLGSTAQGTGTGTTGGSDLPRTGSQSTFPLTTLGIVLVVAGSVIVTVVRNRRSDRSRVTVDS